MSNGKKAPRKRTTRTRAKVEGKHDDWSFSIDVAKKGNGFMAVVRKGKGRPRDSVTDFGPRHGAFENRVDAKAFASSWAKALDQRDELEEIVRSERRELLPARLLESHQAERKIADEVKAMNATKKRIVKERLTLCEEAQKPKVEIVRMGNTFSVRSAPNLSDGSISPGGVVVRDPNQPDLPLVEVVELEEKRAKLVADRDRFNAILEDIDASTDDLELAASSISATEEQLDQIEARIQELGRKGPPAADESSGADA